VFCAEGSTQLVDGLHQQVTLVRDALERAGHPNLPVRGVRCFMEANWPMFGGALTIHDIHVLWPKKFAELLIASDGLDRGQTIEVHRDLGAALTPADVLTLVQAR